MTDWSDINKLKANHDVNGLTSILGNEKNTFFRQAALEALDQIANPAAYPALFKSLQSQVITPESLTAFFGREQILPKIPESVAKWLEYELATAALGKIGYPPNQINQNVMNWIKDQEWADCISAGEKAVGALTEVLNSPDSIVRRCAAGALGQIGAAPDLSNPMLLVPAVGRLVEHLFDEAWDVRQASVWALGQIGNPAAAFGLSFVMHNDGNEAVRQDAANSLRQMGQSAIMPLILRLHERWRFSLGVPSYGANLFDCAVQGLILLGTAAADPLLKAFAAQSPGKRSKAVANALKRFYHETSLPEPLKTRIRAFQGSLVEEGWGYGYEDSHGGGHGVELSNAVYFEL